MKRSFLSLAFLTLAALVVLIFYAPRDRVPETVAVDSLLLPGIADQINNVNRVEIVTAGNNTVATLLRVGDVWQVEQMGGYRADWSKLKVLLVALGQARVIEPKTNKPEYYARLGVEDVVAGDAGSVLVRISTGDQTTGLLVGHQTQGRQGQFVRLEHMADSALVDRVFEVPRQTLDWADARIIDINSSEVAEVEIIHPTAERVSIMKISADQIDFDLVDLPPDRELKGSWAVNSLGSVFTLLDMETVQPESNVDWMNAVKMRLLMFSGVEILADLLETEDEYLLRLHAGQPAARVILDQNGEPLTQPEIGEQAAEDVAKQVEAFNQKVSGWAYGISKQRFESMVKKPEDLLKPLATS